MLAASPTEWLVFGLNGAAVATGKSKWSGVVHLGLVLYGAAFFAEKVLAAIPVQESIWGLDSSGVKVGI